MFNLSDGRNDRRRIIAGYADVDIQLGVLLAAVDFEWTCRRAILALSKNPTVTIRRKFNNDYASFEGISDGWSVEVDTSNGLASHFEGRKVSWSQIREAMKIRNAIVHGSGDSIQIREGRFAVYVLETACDILNDYVRRSGYDLFKPINRRRTKKAIEEEKVQDKEREALRTSILNSANKLGENHWVNRGAPWKTGCDMLGKKSS